MLIPIICVGIPILLLSVFIITDTISAKHWKNAEICKGLILKKMERYAINGYGGNLFSSTKRFYNQYEVEFWIDQVKYIEIVRTKEIGDVGELIEVRYIWDDDELKVVSSMKADRLRDLYIGGSIGLIFGIILIICKCTGML